MLIAAPAIFLITLGLAQLISGLWGLRAASLTGSKRWAGYVLGGLLVLWGGFLLPPGPAAGWPILTLPAAFLAVFLLFGAGSRIDSPTHPDRFFDPVHPEHGGCTRLNLPDGHHILPALLLKPRPDQDKSVAVCLLHGAGDSKTGFKWRLVRALLAEGVTVLTVDLPGHGENKNNPLCYPDFLSAIPSALAFLRNTPGIKRVGLAGISLGGAMAISWLGQSGQWVDALVVIAAPIYLGDLRRLRPKEAWQAILSPTFLSLFREMSLPQLWQSWQEGGYVSRHHAGDLIKWLDPGQNIRRINAKIPIALVYSDRDFIAPLNFGITLQQTAPQTELLVAHRDSHITLTLNPHTNKRLAGWLSRKLRAEKQTP